MAWGRSARRSSDRAERAEVRGRGERPGCAAGVTAGVSGRAAAVRGPAAERHKYTYKFTCHPPATRARVEM